ncbi:cora-domain-containing protein [Pluteus cervinus]|uniref:Cora-domain-containing protein n=1 Tax=Pluteus cervinus TaxID=181527 RepID=A0ACD3ALT8_9AGAR|nr:cora-domain-containing protein [Pluteus cervinus]
MSSPASSDTPLPTVSSPLPISPVNVRRRSLSPAEASELAALPRHSPTISRTFDPNDPQARERQRTMDVDMAIHLSRARRETLSISPSTPLDALQTSPEHMYPTIPTLSPQERREIKMARGDEEPIGHGEVEEQMMPSDSRPLEDQSIPASPTIQHLSHPDDASHSIFGGLPRYQPNISQTQFDFQSMEEFAVVEKNVLGLTSASPRFSFDPARPRPTTSTAVEGPGEAQQTAVEEGSDNNASTSTPRSTPRRKLSHSNPTPRSHRKGIGGKLALFERALGEPSTALPPHLGIPPSSPPSGIPGRSVEHAGILGGNLNTGHDRPYRFSFYSNALSATIHARSLSELPAEGQTFEDLFAGLPPRELHGEPAAHTGRERPGSAGTKLDYAAKNNGNAGNLSKRLHGMKNSFNGHSHLHSLGDQELATWWLDVQSPTDEEMKMLSKVFCIHPLTTEDILMEEAREKIELFHNYYLVCFRSFDQDQYSPTYLEPLNMYIIVFREGILSFHFRPTPHPANVRRRIKQLKDYINVTSDWISYALIDDITDAFGPLIQSIEYEVDSIDELVLILKEAERSDMLLRIGRCRKKVMGLLRLMGNKADVVKGLAKRCNENWRVAPTSDIGLYLSDIQDHLITMTQNLNHYEKILSRSHSNYLAQISIEMTDANNQINDVLSKLTALGTVLIPMNLVTGLWGMNVHVPGQDITEGYVWFVSIIAGLVAFAVIGGYSTYRLVKK